MNGNVCASQIEGPRPTWGNDVTLVRGEVSRVRRLYAAHHNTHTRRHTCDSPSRANSTINKEQLVIKQWGLSIFYSSIHLPYHKHTGVHSPHLHPPCSGTAFHVHNIYMKLFLYTWLPYPVRPRTYHGDWHPSQTFGYNKHILTFVLINGSHLTVCPSF